MSKKIVSYKSKAGNILFSVKRMKKWDRKELVFYLTTEQPKDYIKLANLETIVTMDWQGANPSVIKNPKEVASFLNQKGFNPKDKATTIFTFIYEPIMDKKTPFTEMFEYTVPKSNHEVVVKTPDGQVIIDL